MYINPQIVQVIRQYSLSLHFSANRIAQILCVHRDNALQLISACLSKKEFEAFLNADKYISFVEIKALLSKGLSLNNIAARLNMRKSLIRDIISEFKLDPKALANTSFVKSAEAKSECLAKVEISSATKAPQVFSSSNYEEIHKVDKASSNTKSSKLFTSLMDFLKSEGSCLCDSSSEPSCEQELNIFSLTL